MSELALGSSNEAERGRFEEFSLLGGPLHRLGARLGLVRDGTNTIALGRALGWLPWLILVALTLLAGGTHKLFSLAAAPGHVRMLLAIPLFFLCETRFDLSAREFIRTVTRSEVVPKNALPRFESEIARTVRWKDSWLPDATSLLAALLLSLLGTGLGISGGTAPAEAAISGPSLGSLWYWVVCLPLFRFLLFRWLWRIALWWRFLWRMTKLELHLVPTHPDSAAGLGYLEVVQSHLFTLILAISMTMSASLAEEISSGKAAFEVVYSALAISLVANLALFVGPLCVFATKLRTCQEKGLSEYMEFASRYVNEFEQKWVHAAIAPEQPLLGTPDLQSLADLSNSRGVVRKMRWIPISARLLALMLIAAVLPMLPLVLFKYPVAELAEKVLKKLAGL